MLFIEARKIADLRPGLGPLGGLHTALSAAQFETVAVVACDMPFANAALLVAAADILQHEQVDVVIAESPEGFEPMHAVYRRSDVSAGDRGGNRCRSTSGDLMVSSRTSPPADAG